MKSIMFQIYWPVRGCDSFGPSAFDGNVHIFGRPGPHDGKGDGDERLLCLLPFMEF